MKIHLNKILPFLLVLLLPAAGFADTVYLKNGKKITGKISRETSYSIRMEVNGVPFTYYNEEIEKIVKGEEKVLTLQEIEEGMQRKQELVLRFLDANGAREAMGRIFLQIINQAPREAQGELKKVLQVDKIIERLVPVYNKYYTEDDLKELINFYISPLGKKHLEVTPQVLEETLSVATTYFKEMLAEVEQKEIPAPATQSSPLPDKK